MTKNKVVGVTYNLTVIIGTLLISGWAIYVAYLMFHGIMNNCPAQTSNFTFPNSYYGPSGSVSQPHILSGSILVLLVLLLIAAAPGNLKYKRRNYKIFTLALMVSVALVAIEINKRTSIPSTCVFNG